MCKARFRDHTNLVLWRSAQIYCILDVPVAVAVVDSCGPYLHKTKFEVSSQFNPQEVF